ncbi:MAG: hypothetical protein IPO44_03935 [Candidatus Microthrix sp.]|nr:hypothetical protein [Candidatus Microthrix sp.]MBK9558739.1 hypothetical protein [Candidatus Microthrix sp.]
MFVIEKHLGYEVVAFVDDDPDAPETIDGIPVDHQSEDLVELADAKEAQGVIIATTAMSPERSNRLVREAVRRRGCTSRSPSAAARHRLPSTHRAAAWSIGGRLRRAGGVTAGGPQRSEASTRCSPAWGLFSHRRFCCVLLWRLS